MNRRLLNILLIAFVIAAGCSYIVFRLVGNRLSGTRQTSAHVVAAATDIKLGTVLRDADLTTIEITGTLPKGAILKKENAIGRGVISNLYLGEPVLENRLAAPGSGGGLAAALSLLARDRQGPRLIAQFLDAPTINDRLNTPSMTTLSDTPLWQSVNSPYSWRYYLQGTAEPGSADVPIYAAPARATVEDLAGLPPAFVTA